MWKKPWGYKEGFTVCIGLFLTGVILQNSVGKVDWDLLSFPINIILLIFYLGTLSVIHLLKKKVYAFRWMSHYSAVVPAIICAVVITVIMGLIRQYPSQYTITGVESWLGFSQMLSAWPFILLYGWFTSLLGLTTLRRIFPFRLRNIPFILNHAGLFIALVGATFGNADMQRLEMSTSIGKPEWRALDTNRNIVEPPFAIELNHFTIDEYPPKLMFIDNENGKVLPAGNPVNLLLEEDITEGELLDWHIKIKLRIPEAASLATEDTLKFVEFHSIGCTYAIYVEATQKNTHIKKEGWLSNGSFMFPYKALRLTEEMSLIMPEREPRRFASEVTVYTKSEKIIEGTIEVNKPLEIEGWKIYQVSYDEAKGKWSDVSVFELVHDPWLPGVYTGIFMMLAGAVCMFLTAGKRKEETV